MFDLPIAYDQPVFRPPGEAQSLLIQLTLGCSHNRCSFCAMYRTKRFRVRTFDEVAQDLEAAAAYAKLRREVVRKIFLCDGDALGAPTSLLLEVTERINLLFPGLRRIGIYATAKNVIRKNKSDLEALRENKLALAYIGLESGSNDVLRAVNKGNSAEDLVEAAARLNGCGWQTSLIVMLGLGGRRWKDEHQSQTAKIVSEVSPRFLSFLTTVPIPGTEYQTQITQGAIEPLSSRELLEELAYTVDNVECRSPIILRANHVSNQFPLEGTLPKDRQKLRAIIAAWIDACPHGLYPRTDPLFL